MWYSKRHTTVETSTLSSDFIAFKNCVEHIVLLSFKLHMFGVPVEYSSL